MNMRTQLAFRNLFRHPLRSFLSGLMIAMSVAAIILFKGIGLHTTANLAKVVGEQQYGHVQIATQNYWDRSVKSAKEKLLANADDLAKKIKTVPEVHSVSGRLSIKGILNFNGNSQAIFISGFDPVQEPEVRKNMTIHAGGFFSSADTKEVLVGQPLAKAMRIKPGDEITILCMTIDGAYNGIDMKVAGIYATGLSEVDAHTVFTPLKTLQTIYDTDKVDVLAVRGANLNLTARLLEKLKPVISGTSQKLIAKPWYDLSDLYKQLLEFNGVQNSVIETIIIALIILGISNIVGMSIIERTGEIGTIRAIGETRGELARQFIIESIILGIIGTLFGFIISILGANGLNAANIAAEMPGSSTPMKIQIDLVPWVFAYAFIVTQIATVVATLIPGIRATRISIVEALRKNI